MRRTWRQQQPRHHGGILHDHRNRRFRLDHGNRHSHPYRAVAHLNQSTPSLVSIVSWESPVDLVGVLRQMS